MDKTCCFCGHADTPPSVKRLLYPSIRELICTKQVTNFLVGNQGAFDRMVLQVLSDLQKESFVFQYSIVLAYLPQSQALPYTNTVYPEGLENIPQRFAITHRNRWMVNQSEYMIAYVEHTYGGAAATLRYAVQKNKSIINLATLL